MPEPRYAELRQEIALAHQAWQHGDLSPLLRVFLKLVDALEAVPVTADLQVATALMEATAYEVDCWFPDDPRSTIQDDLRTVAGRLRTRYGLSQFVPDDHGGHLQAPVTAHA